MLVLDFGAPGIARHRLPKLSRWRPVLQTVVKEHPKGFALDGLSKIGVYPVVIILTMAAIVCRCFCLGAIPCIGSCSVLLLPLSGLQLSDLLVFLKQLGPDGPIFPPTQRPARE